MPAPRKYTDDQFLFIYQLVEEGLTTRAACRKGGIPHTTYLRWLEREGKATKKEIVLPKFPEEDIEAEKILDHLEESYEQHAKYREAITWFPIKVKTDKPIGICWFGDPHLGNPGCNISLLRKDVRIVVSTPGLYGANIGDTVDNWGGRLTRLYAETTMTRTREQKHATWFLKDTNIPWLLWLMGNHEFMDGAFEAHIKATNGNVIPMMDWRARFILEFANKRAIRVDASHDFKGHSMWNEMHALDRAAITEGSAADLFVAGHRHTWGLKVRELPDNTVTTLVRVRGYKHIDTFADRHGFVNQINGSSVVTVLDPHARSPVELVRAFADVEEGADYLRWKRCDL